MIFDLQLFGGKGGNTYESRPDPPTADELRLQKVQADFAEKTAPNAFKLQEAGANMLWNNPGIVPVNYTAMGQQATQQAQGLQQQAAALGRGEINPQFLENQKAYINDGMQGTIGSALNSLSARGILDSSVTSGAMDSIGRNINAQLAGQYNNNLNQQASNLEQQRGLLSMPMELMNSAQNASIDIPNKLLGMSRGEMANTSNLWQNMAQQRIASKPDVMVQPDNGGLLGGLAQGIGAYYGAACFVVGTKISTPDGDKNIEDIKVGDKVLSLDDECNVIEETVTFVADPVISPDEYLKVSTDAGEVLTTSTQPFITVEGEVLAGELMDDVIFTLDGYAEVEEVAQADKELVYDLSTTGRNIYFANGLAAKGRE